MRGIANQLAQKKGRPDCLPGDQAMDVDQGVTPQNNQNKGAASSNQNASQTSSKLTTGGIHTNDGTTVKQYFSYYAKLANQ